MEKLSRMDPGGETVRMNHCGEIVRMDQGGEIVRMDWTGEMVGRKNYQDCSFVEKLLFDFRSIDVS